jgi:hypothetical protein
MTGLSQLGDAYIPNNGLIETEESRVQFVKRCSKERKDQELAVAKAEIAAAPVGKRILVRFAVSAGTPVDHVAYLAHKRSILRKYTSNEKMETPYAVGAGNTLAGWESAKYYVTDHTEARRQYIQGERCYFATLPVVREGSGKLNFLFPVPAGYSDADTFKHSQAVMFFGDDSYVDQPTCDRERDTSCRQTPKDLSPRLFAPLNDSYKANPQIVPLYVADIRSAVVDADLGGEKILADSFTSAAVRRHEYEISFRRLFNLDVLFAQRNRVEVNLSKSASVKGKSKTYPGDESKTFVFGAYEGVQQLIDNIIFSGLEGLIMSTNYTPIVLDLGQPGIATASLDWGSFFNVANLQRSDLQAADPLRMKVTHQSAWLGGPLKLVQESNSQALRRISEDGFLVVPKRNSAGGYVVQTAEELVGQFLKDRAGKTYENGYLALQARLGKDCASTQIKHRYFGPWDGVDYSDNFRVWVDANRNGKGEADEFHSLESAGVAALNTCNVIDKVASDAFGNMTDLRSAFLYRSSEAILAGEDAILRALKTGLVSEGVQANFRASIDVFFRARKEHYLEDLDPSVILDPSASRSNSNLSTMSVGVRKRAKH